MVLLENFRAEPLTGNFWRSHGSIFICLLLRMVAHYDATHSKVRKESHHERAEGKEKQFFTPSGG